MMKRMKKVKRIADWLAIVGIGVAVILTYCVFSTDDYIVSCLEKGIQVSQTTPWWLLGIAILIGGVSTVYLMITNYKE